MLALLSQERPPGVTCHSRLYLMARLTRWMLTFLALFILLAVLRTYLAPHSFCPGPILTVDSHLSHEALLKSFAESLRQTMTQCARHHRLGRWDVCLSRTFYNVKPCHVMSFTTEGPGQFESLAKRFLGCRVDVFSAKGDARVGHRPLPSFDQEGWLSELLTKESDPVTILALDVGPHAWDAIEVALETGSMIRVRQLAVAFESKGQASSRTDLLRYLAVLGGLEVGLGFQKWNAKRPNQSEELDCIEGFANLTCRHPVTWINSQLFPPC